MVKIELIHAFMAIVENNSFNAAAKQLSKSTAAISQKISALEKHLGVELIKRDTRNIEITPIGQSYYEQCRRIFSEMERAEKLIKTQHLAPTGKLKVACPVKSIIPKIVAFKNEYPDIELIIDSNERFPNLEKNKIDIIVGITLSPPADYVKKEIGQVRYTLCGSKKYFKKHGLPKSPHDLIHHRYIAHTVRLNERQLQFNEGALVVPVEPWIWLNDTQAMLECAKNDIGIVSLHSFVTNDAIEKGELVEIFEELQSEEPLCVYYPYHQYLEPKIKLFVSFIEKAFCKS